MKFFSATPLIVLGIFAALFVLEKFFPLRKRTAGLVSRLVVNGAISALVLLVALTVVRPFALRSLHWSMEKPFGLLHLWTLPIWAEFILGFLLLDLGFYYWHLLNHKSRILWRFHNVHHIDPDLDISTGFRFHFGEVLFSTVFRVVQVSLIGVSPVTFVVYELIFQANTLFHHSNLRLPISIERLLNLLLVTPRMHGIHHSQVKRETNSNYGVVFPWWDRLHRTLGLNVSQSEIKIGVPAYSAAEDNKLWRTVTLPFMKQRDYWRRPEGAECESNPLSADPGHLEE